MHWPHIGVLFYAGILFTQRVDSTALRCETDSECPKPLVCRLLCKRTCNSVCVRLKPTQQVIFDHSRLQVASYENEPFSTQSDMFIESNMDLSTPSTVDEMQIGSKELITDNNLPQRDIQIDPIRPTLSHRSHHSPEISRIPKVVPLNDHPRGPPAPPIRHHLQTRVPPAPLNLNENSIDEFTEPPRTRIRSPNGPVPIPNGPPSSPPPETIQISVPSIPPSHRLNRPGPQQAATLPPWRKTRLPVAANRPSFRGHIQSSHPIKPPNIPEKLPKEKECPPPQICEKNCGISIDEDGCQSCKCLWISALCRQDRDCPQNVQFCDFGRCECRSGFVHSQIRSGVCERALSDPPHIPTHSGFRLNAVKNVLATTEAYKPRPRRSELSSQKLNREGRLQWPGPCDSDAECPSNLYCINSDCWNVPDKPLRSFQIENPNLTIRRAPQKKVNDQLFPLSNENDYNEQETTQALPPSILPDETTTNLPETTTKLPETTTLSEITTSDGFVTRPFKSKKPGKSKIPLPVEPFTDDPLPEFNLNPLPSTITETELDKEIEELANSFPQITDDQLDKEVDSISSTKMPEFTRPTKSTKNHRITTTQIPPSTTETWKEMSREWRKEFILSTTESNLATNKIAPVFLDYSNRRNKPVRIESFNAKDRIQDECVKTEDCGHRYVCCAKRYCDLSFNCGNGRFCLPNCRLTKMIHLPGTLQRPNETLIDLVYD